MLDNTQIALDNFSKRVISRSRANLTRMGKRVGNSLYNSLDYDLNVSENSFSLEFIAEDYADFVDRGVSGKKVKYNTPFSFRSKMPPRNKILQWVNARRFRLRDPKTGKFKKGGQNSLAFLIQRSIYNKGIKPTHFFTRPFEAAFRDLPTDLEEAYGLDTEDFIDFTFREHNTRK